MSTENEKVAGFIDSGELKIGNQQLRPLTAEGLLILRQTKNPLAGIPNDLIDDPLFHIAAFIYVQSAPPAEVRLASLSPNTYRDAVLKFTDNLSIPHLVQAADPLRKMVEKAMVGMDYQIDGDAADPN